MARVKVLMTASRGANFAGEMVYFDEERALQFVEQKACVLLDENDNPILPESGPVEESAEGSGNIGGNTGNDGGTSGNDAGKGKGKKNKKPAGNQPNPFEIDGFDPKIVAALADAGIHTADDLRAYVATGKTLAELPAIGVVSEKELLDLYGSAN